MGDKILFVAPAKLNPVDDDGRPLQNVRENISLPALTVLGSLKAHGYEVEFIDLSADGDEQKAVARNVQRFGLPDEAVLEKISELDPLALLITSMFTTEQQTVDELAATVKASFPKLPIIVGGIHASLQPGWMLDGGNIDFVVLGEGELSILELIGCIKDGWRVCRDVRGIAYMDNGRVKVVPARPPLDSLKGLEFSFDEVLLRGNGYRYLEPASRRTPLYNHLAGPSWERCYSLYYSRGCPLHCDYCASSEKDGLKVRHAGSRRMFEDFKRLHREYGVSIFYNQADAFCGNPHDIEFLKMVREYRRENADFVISNPNAFYVRIFFPSHRNYELNEELLDLLAAAGVNVVTLAVETFNQVFNRKINFDKVSPRRLGELLEAIHARGMKTGIYMMYAFPEQTSEELFSDEEIIEALPQLDRVDWQNCMVFPGTEYYRRGLASGWFTTGSYRRALRRGYFFHTSPPEFNFSRIPQSELEAFRERNHSDFQ